MRRMTGVAAERHAEPAALAVSAASAASAAEATRRTIVALREAMVEFNQTTPGHPEQPRHTERLIPFQGPKRYGCCSAPDAAP